MPYVCDIVSQQNLKNCHLPAPVLLAQSGQGLVVAEHIVSGLPPRSAQGRCAVIRIVIPGQRYFVAVEDGRRASRVN